MKSRFIIERSEKNMNEKVDRQLNAISNYVSELENENANLKEENEKLTHEIEFKDELIASLKEENEELEDKYKIAVANYEDLQNLKESEE